MPNPRLALLLSILLTLSACSTTQPPSANGGLPRQHNEGYSLLYKLFSDDKDVGKIFIIKGADDTIANVIREVGDFAGNSKDQMDQFPKSDPRIEYDVADLPWMDARSRQLQADDDEHTLLTESGKGFELNLIFTQIQAMDYAHQLSKALLEKEDDPTRKAFLQKVIQQAAAFHDRLLGFLTVK